MRRSVFLLNIILVWLSFLPLNLEAAEKVRFGSGLKFHPVFVLPALAALENRFWEKQGLEVEWVTFNGVALLNRAAAARSIDLGISESTAQIQGVAAGLPIIIVAHLGVENDFFFYVRGDSPITKPADLRGKKVAITQFAGSLHAYGRAVVRELGLEKEIKFVALGGSREIVAGVMAGAVDALMSTLFNQAPLKLQGKLRDVVAVRDYLPRPWLNRLILARKEFLQTQRSAAKRTVAGALEATNFIMKDQEWTVAKMVSFSNYTEGAARLVYPALRFSPDGKTESQAVANVRKFLIENGIVSEAKAVPVEALFSNDLVE